MTEILTLVAKKRNPSKQGNRSLEAEKQVLGVVYGHGVDPVSVSVNASDVLRTYRKAGNSTLVELDIEGKKATVLLKVVSLHPVRHEINHIDFFAVNLKEKTTINVNFEFLGKSAAVDTFGGVFVVSNRSIDIKCFPADSPRNIKVNKELLKEIGDSITVKDLNLYESKFELVNLKEDSVICSVIAKRVEAVKEENTEEDGGEAGTEEGVKE